MTAVTNVEPSSVPVWRLEQASTGASDVDNWTHLRRPKVAVLSTYPPTKCGLATFAADVEAALASAGAEVRMVAIEPLPTVAMAPPQVLATINKQDRGSYARAANVVNDWNPDAVLVEHEFGIFGGPDGAFVLDFVDQVHVPVFVTLHTVLTHPSEGQRRVLEGLAQRVAGFTVFTETARAAFRGQFGTGATEERPATNIWATRFGIEVIAHGAPVEVCRVPRSKAPSEALVSMLGPLFPLVDPHRFVLGTFGLLSPGKGLEQAIDALGLLVDSHPQLSLVIAGQTHPEIRLRDGESYRNSLMERCAKVGVTDHVAFVDGYLSVPEIAEFLARTDLFCTPYRDMDQVVSGALTFALAAGCAVVSTPYRYAVDVLSDGAGTLVPAGDSAAMAAAVMTFVDGPLRLLIAQRAASPFRTWLSWPSVGASLLEVISRAERSATTARCHAARAELTALSESRG